jgi:hypothetical protein
MGIKRLIFILSIIILTSSPINAATITWDFAGDGLWIESSNWSPANVPAPWDDVVINDIGSGTITVDTDATIKTLTSGGGPSDGHKIVLSTNKLTISASSSALLKVFVTSATHNGNLGGLLGADAICQTAANIAGLSGTYRAWLSDTITDAYCHLHGLTGTKASNCNGAMTTPYGPWVRLDGFPFGESIDIITSINQIYAPVSFDETGAIVTSLNDIFTDTNGSGERYTGYTDSCSNWTVAVGGKWAETGSASKTGGGWTNSGGAQCSSSSRLLCMQVGVGPALPSHTSSGKIAFVTSISGTGNLSTWPGASGSGIAAGDAICRARATDAVLAHAANFKAWLSDDTTDAKTHITTDGPWVRIDGVRIANSKADLTDGKLFSSTNQTETGDYQGNIGVWTGTDESGNKVAGSNCVGWTSALNTDNGMSGNAYNTLDSWTAQWTESCDGSYLHLYCFED